MNPLSSSIRCKSNEIAQGLLLAKRQSAILLVDDNAASIASLRESATTRDHLVILDDNEDISPVVVANYAFSIDADLELLTLHDQDLSESTYGHIRARSSQHTAGDRSNSEFIISIDTRIRSELEDFQPRKFVTFLARSFPYGLFWQDSPSTHIFSQGSDISIPAAICSATNKKGLVSGVLLDPGALPKSETPEIGETLKSWGVVVATLADTAASVHNARLFLRSFPADLFFICSHCGIMNGHRIRVKIPCHDDNEHVFEFETLLSINSDRHIIDGVEHVLASEYFSPVSIDGIDWNDADREFKGDWLSFLEHGGDIWNHLVGCEETKGIPNTTAIELSNGPFVLLTLDAFDTAVSPIIVNNACVSFFTAARHMVERGAQCYIGTLAPVENNTAREFAIQFFKSEDSSESTAVSVFNIQKKLWDNHLDRIYVHVGCHFCSLVRPNPGSKNELLARIRASKARWSAYLGQPQAQGKVTAQEYYDFLSQCENKLAKVNQ